MEPLEFDFMRETVHGFLDLEIPKNIRAERPMSKLQMLKREVRKLDPYSREIFTNWLLEFDLEARERQFRREERL
ncbi:MAG: hypothetical protein ACHQ2Z_05080 [Elusimicrobiota bacterium]